MKKKWKKGAAFMALLILVSTVCRSGIVFAAIKDETVFKDVQWNLIGETPVLQDQGWVQSMCTTDDYIICLENASNKKSDPDTLIAFYKNDYDENGNPVEQYSVAKYVTEMDYEHGNGMTYNPNTNELMIVGSTPLNPENQGYVYIVDAETLKFKKKVHVTNHNLLGIAYDRERNQYIIQIFDSGYKNVKFIFTDTDFNIVDNGFAAKVSSGLRHQDFCVSGDYLISLAFTQNVDNSNVMHIYSLDTKEFLTEYQMTIDGNKEFIEPESIAELGADEIIIANGQKNPRRISFYTAEVDAAFKVTTSVENGEISSSQKTVDYGSEYTVNYSPEENYELESITVDGTAVDIGEYPDSYTFSNVSQNHSIEVKFKEKPKYTITTKVENGAIDGSVTLHRDNSLTVNYTPYKHYELGEIVVDGEAVDTDTFGKSYTFENIQSDHTIEVTYQEIPSFEVKANVTGGTVSETSGSVYRDQAYTVAYEANKDYKLGYIIVDGRFMWGSELNQHLTGYTFENVQGGHEITVFFYYKYIPYLLWAVLASGVLFILHMTWLHPASRRRRKMKRYYRKHRRIRKQLEEKHVEMEQKVRAKMDARDEAVLEEALKEGSKKDEHNG
ncbi:MAG TPA: hypothetical protein IAB53_03400 [Candidatus Scybalocola faecipullorum]|nr:hypothetical protein [Candidatus Scybalocola faecipullorum]